jgi:hypothetical protein
MLSDIDPRWVSALIFVAVFGGFVALLLISRKLERAGRIKNYSRGLGHGILHVDALLRPSRQHVIEAKQHEEKENDESGGPDKTQPPDGVCRFSGHEVAGFCLSAISTPPEA